MPSTTGETVNPVSFGPTRFAFGGSTSFGGLNVFNDEDGAPKIDKKLIPSFTKARTEYELTGMPHKAGGGEIEGHNPEFFSEGGASLAHRYVKGHGDGTSDSVPAMLATGEFVIPADVVSNLGNGDNDSGAKVLDEFLQVIRKHKRAADARQLPPDSKGPLAYLTDAKRKARK